MPSLPVHNRFSILSVDIIPEIDESAEKNLVVSKQKTKPLRIFRPRWERRLPPKLTIASSDGGDSRSLKVEVTVETTDTGKAYVELSLVDSGASGEFIDRDYVHRNKFTTRSLSVPIPVHNIDGTPNEAGSITEVAELVLR